MWSDHIRSIPDFPKDGILFRDIMPVFSDVSAFSRLIGELSERVGDATHIAGIEARGFIIGAALARHTALPFVPIRKAGKLPGDTASVSYELEYGSATIEIDATALSDTDRVIIVDDLIATGGTTLAAASLIERLGARVASVLCAIDLPDVGGSKRLRDAGYRFDSLISFEEE